MSGKHSTDALPATPAEQHIADTIHGATCRLSHQDQCGYDYVSWDNPNGSRLPYLETARRLLQVADGNETLVRELLAELYATK